MCPLSMPWATRCMCAPEPDPAALICIARMVKKMQGHCTLTEACSRQMLRWKGVHEEKAISAKGTAARGKLAREYLVIEGRPEAQELSCRAMPTRLPRLLPFVLLPAIHQQHVKNNSGSMHLPGLPVSLFSSGFPDSVL